MFLERVTTEQKPQGLRVMIYGEPKVGKSYFGAQIPNHVFLNLENGLEHLKGANKLPYTDNYDDVKLMLKELENCEHPFKTLVVDSADVLENLIKKWIVKQQNNSSWKDVADIPFGRGYPLLLTETRNVIDQFEKLRIKRGMNIVFICHSEVKKMQPPVGAEYTYIAPSLYAKTTQGDSTLKIYSDYVDIIGYCTFKNIVQQTSTGFGTRGQATRLASGRRESCVYCWVSLYDAAGNTVLVAGFRYCFDRETTGKRNGYNITNRTRNTNTRSIK